MTEIHCEFDQVPLGKLTVGSGRYIPEVSTARMRIKLVKDLQQERARITQFIEDIYQQTYQADIKVDYPFLFCLEDAERGIQATAGFRPAADIPLFLEQYLSSPVEEQVLCDRSEIVEIGNLAGTGQGAATFLFAVMAAYFDHQNFTIAVATGSPFLERRFRQLGLQPRKLAPARQNSLKTTAENWGSYYRSEPYVMAGSISQGYQRLKSIFGLEFFEFPFEATSPPLQRKVKWHAI
ncbi:thermostable hemolysin [Sneathiella limimaris]|uniref:thermostable hemolysin n=1 Tax=Sneathiella limimaris TaxID=1964213 RepID=UPI00146A7660|nr:thermostable hemolysin [Sneathiella limimaris]